MNTNFFSRLATVLMCCVLLNSARAQEVEPPPSPDDTTTSSETFGPDEHHRHHHGGRNDAVVSLGHKADLAAGEHADAVVAVFGSATSAGNVDDAIVSILGNTRVTGGRVGNTAVAVLGSVYVNGEVNGDVVAVLGKVELGPEARVRGDIVVVGGDLTRDPAATVGGSVQRILTSDWMDFDWLRPWMERCLLYGRPLAFSHGLGWAWTLALGMLALYVFIAFLFRGAVERCVETLEAKPGNSVLAALLTMLLTPVLFVLLIITVVGIAALPFLVVALFAAAAFGKVVVLASIGRRCTPMLTGNPAVHTVVGVIVGAAIVLFLYTIPVIGFIVYKLLGILGLGVVMYTLLIGMRSGREARAAARGPGDGPGATGSPGGSGGGLGESPGPDPGPHQGPGTGPGLRPGPAVDAVSSMSSGPGPTPGAWQTSGPASDASGASGPTPTSQRAEPTMSSSTSNFGDFAAGPDPVPPGGAVPPSGPGPSASGAGPNTAGSAGLGGGGLGGAAPAAPGAASFGGAGPASLPRAGFAIRMGALLLDIVLIGILLHQFHDGSRLTLLVLAGYGAVMWKLRGATIGGIICGLQVARLDGRPIDWPTAIVRALSCFLSLAVAGLGFLWIAIDSERQSWHDKIAGTIVVKAPKGASLI